MADITVKLPKSNKKKYFNPTFMSGYNKIKANTRKMYISCIGIFNFILVFI